ncbi:MAG: holo-ACP synthase [Patescibacteria group bacterium]
MKRLPESRRPESKTPKRKAARREARPSGPHDFPSIGVDIESIGRFKGLARRSSLIERVFTSEEIAYCFSKANPAQHLAARYAGKEAVMKALGSVMGRRFTPAEYAKIAITTDADGAPGVELHLDDACRCFLKLSLSHADGYAIAVAFIDDKTL